MPDSLICINARSALNNINSLKASFGSAFQKAVESGAAADISRAETLKLSLEAAITNLQETINKHEAERRFELELKRQYSDQVKLLKSAKLIESRKEKDSSGAEREFLFMTGIDGENTLYRLMRSSPSPSLSEKSFLR